jgi:hypothetical protein
VSRSFYVLRGVLLRCRAMGPLSPGVIHLMEGTAVV